MGKDTVLVERPTTNGATTGNEAPPLPVMQADALYIAAKHELAAGHKDAGLRLLWALRHDLTQVPTENGDFQRLKKLLDNTVSLWGEGFDWD